jgi:hypothetical protein
LKELLKKHQTLIIRVYVAIQGQYTLNQNFISFSILNHLYQKNYNGCIRAVTPCLLFFEKLAVTPWGCLDSLFSGVAARKSEKVRKSAPNTLRFLRGAATQPESGFSSSPPLASNARQRTTKPNRPHVSLKNRSRFALSIAIQG